MSAGRQYDRLAIMYLGDNEVWRTSTAEPTPPPGIRWSYAKDMTAYLALWREPQTLIFDLGNLVNDLYTASLNATLTATFLWVDDDDVPGTEDGWPPADVVIPISAGKGAQGQASVFTLPADNATVAVSSFPRNARRAVFSLAACGQATEEFWWSNVPQADVAAFNATAGAFYGFSPFREAQVLIDGRLAGVAWPFPVIFTGGVVPGLHRPIVGVDDFDLPEYAVDVTPWLPLLSDGASHEFAIRVAGIGADGALTETVGASWLVTGKVFVWLDDDDGDAVTTGSAPAIEAPAPHISVTQALTQNATGANETLTYSVEVRRTLTVSADVRTSRGSGTAVWSQTLAYTNQGYVYAYGFGQFNNVTTTGADAASGAAAAAFRASYDYPLFCNQTYAVSAQGNLTIWAHLVQGLGLGVEGAAVYPTGLEAFEAGVPQTLGRRFGGAALQTTLEGTAGFYETGDQKNSSGYGTTNQVFRFGGTEPEEELYYRDVTAVNGSVVFDEQRLAGQHAGGGSWAPPPRGSLRAFIWGLFAQLPRGGGRGPRASRGNGESPGPQ